MSKRKSLILAAGGLSVALLATAWFIRFDLLRASVCDRPWLASLLFPTVSYQNASFVFAYSLDCPTQEAARSFLKITKDSPEFLTDHRVTQAVISRCHMLPPAYAAELIDILIAAGKPLNGDEGQGYSILSEVSSVPCAKQLMAKGAKPEVNGFSALLSMWEDVVHLPVFVELLRAGANPNAVEPLTALTPLRRATKPAFVKALLDHGADPNLKGADGSTPLDYAYENKQSPEKIALLIEHGAITSKYGSPSDAELERLRKNEGRILGEGRFSDMVKRRCRISVSVPNGSTFIEGSEEWSMQLGTPMKVTARCMEGRVFHWALLTGEDILLPKGRNIAMIDGVGEVTITITKPVSSVPLVFFVSDKSVGNLVSAVEKGDAKPAGMRVVSADNAAN